MENKEGFSKSRFPDGLEYIGDVIRPQINEIRQVEEKIKSLPDTPHSTLKFELNPPGSSKVGRANKFIDTRNYLNGRLSELENDLRERISAETKNLDPENVRLIKEAIIDMRNPSPFEGKSERDLDLHKNTPKDLTNSQHYMHKLLVNSRLKLEHSIHDKENDPNPVDFKKNEAAKTVAGKRYISSLSHTPIQEMNLNNKGITKPNPPQKNEIDINRE